MAIESIYKLKLQLMKQNFNVINLIEFNGIILNT